MAKPLSNRPVRRTNRVSNPAAGILRRAKDIRLLAMDVDGVLTRGEVIVLESGEEVKAWNAKDRLALALLRKKNISLVIAWITGRQSNAVTRSAKDVGIDHLVQNCGDTKKALEEILHSHHLQWNQVAFIGDDLIDLPVLLRAGLACCPADAVPEVVAHSHYISPFRGGEGTVRDVLELILKAQNQWSSLVQSILH